MTNDCERNRKIVVWILFWRSISHVNRIFILLNYCSHLKAPDPECNKKCANGGWCNHDKICQCPEGYMGQYCQTALCYPQCMNGGFCTAPAVCSCPKGYQGRHCEGGKYRNEIQVDVEMLQFLSFQAIAHAFVPFHRDLRTKVFEWWQMHPKR